MRLPNNVGILEKASLNPFVPDAHYSERVGILKKASLNSLVPDAHYSERQLKLLSLQIQQLEVDLKGICGFLFAPWGLIG